MTFIFLIISFLFPQNTYVNDSVKKTIFLNNVTKVIKLDKKETQNSTQVLIYTVKKDSLKHNKPLNSIDNEDKIILIKESSDSDLFKYIFPIFTLILGIVLNQLFDYLNNKKRILKIGNRWIEELRILEQPIVKQKESISSFIEEIEKQEFNIPKLEIFADIDGEKFKALDKNEFINFLEQEKGKLEYKEIIRLSNKFHGNVSILSSLHNLIKERFNKFITESSKQTSSFNNHFQELLKSFSDYQIYLENKYGGDVTKNADFKPVSNLFLIFIQPHIKDGNLDIFKLEKLFFQKLIEVLTPYRHDTQALKLSRTTTTCLNDIKSLKLERSYIVKNLKSLNDQYSALIDRLNELTNSLDKH